MILNPNKLNWQQADEQCCKLHPVRDGPILMCGLTSTTEEKKKFLTWVQMCLGKYL